MAMLNVRKAICRKIQADLNVTTLPTVDESHLSSSTNRKVGFSVWLSFCTVVAYPIIELGNRHQGRDR